MINLNSRRGATQTALEDSRSLSQVALRWKELQVISHERH